MQELHLFDFIQVFDLTTFVIFFYNCSSTTMKVLFQDIPEDGLALDIDLNINAKSLINPVVGYFAINKAKEVLHITGNIKYGLNLECNLCLQPFDKAVESRFSVTYMPVETIKTEETRELAIDELEVCFYEKEEVDIYKMVLQQIDLNRDMHAICSESCKGLCSQCGVDLNNESCNCTRAVVVDERFFKLKDYFKRSNGYG